MNKSLYITQELIVKETREPKEYKNVNVYLRSVKESEIRKKKKRREEEGLISL